MSDNTIQVWVVGNSYDYELTFTVDPAFTKDYTAYRLYDVEVGTIPHPVLKFVVANGKEMFRFMCGPDTTCQATLAAPVPLPSVAHTGFKVEAIESVNYLGTDHYLLVHAGGVVRVARTPSALNIVDYLDWSQEPWFKAFPVDHLRGVVRTYQGRNGQARGRLAIAIGPSSGNNTAVGLLVNVIYDNLSSPSIQAVAMLPQSAQNLGAHEKDSGDGMVYYWCIQEPTFVPSAKNAFVMSHGGSPQDARTYAAATFPPGVHWSSEVFLFDRGDLLGTAKVGMIVSGNETMAMRPGSLGGFDVWAPRYNYGNGWLPSEVVLGNPTHVFGFGMPILAKNVFGEFLGSMASMASKGADGCWYAVIIDWFANDPHGMAANGNTQSSESSETSKVDQNLHQSDRQDVSFVNLEREATFAPDCHVSTCSIDSPGDCPIGKCWARGSLGGFQCCQHPPV